MQKVILITGASGGIGREIVKLYLQKKYSLILSGRNEKGFEYVKNDSNVNIVLGDITKNETRDKLVNLVKNKYKKT